MAPSTSSGRAPTTTYGKPGGTAPSGTAPPASGWARWDPSPPPASTATTTSTSSGKAPTTTYGKPGGTAPTGTGPPTFSGNNQTRPSGLPAAVMATAAREAVTQATSLIGTGGPSAIAPRWSAPAARQFSAQIAPICRRPGRSVGPCRAAGKARLSQGQHMVASLVSV